MYQRKEVCKCRHANDKKYTNVKKYKNVKTESIQVYKLNVYKCFLIVYAFQRHRNAFWEHTNAFCLSVSKCVLKIIAFGNDTCFILKVCDCILKTYKCGLMVYEYILRSYECILNKDEDQCNHPIMEFVSHNAAMAFHIFHILS